MRDAVTLPFSLWWNGVSATLHLPFKMRFPILFRFVSYTINLSILFFSLLFIQIGSSCECLHQMFFDIICRYRSHFGLFDSFCYHQSMAFNSLSAVIKKRKHQKLIELLDLCLKLVDWCQILILIYKTSVRSHQKLSTVHWKIASVCSNKYTRNI